MASSSNMLEFVSDLLEKMVDSAANQAQNLTSLKESISQITTQTKDNWNITQKDLEYIKHQFSNGFRKELRDHVTDEVGALRNEEINALRKILIEQDEHLKTIVREVRSYRKISFWAKVLSGLLVAAASIAFAAAQIVQSISGNDISDVKQAIVQSKEDMDKKISEIQKAIEFLEKARGTNPDDAKSGNNHRQR